MVAPVAPLIVLVSRRTLSCLVVWNLTQSAHFISFAHVCLQHFWEAM